MDKLGKQQKEELATALCILALYDGEAEISADQINTLLDAANIEVEAFYPIIFANFLSTPKKILDLICSPGGTGGGGGGGGGAAAAGADAAAEEAPKEEEKEEEEMDLGGGMDMFGGEEAGGGDY
eukprot:CAMPEP_0172423394 /NCGR_PEP_ID=MMETSP1064-20121228/15988_1 /TAXON_ID=202472 /ORGANISM="Aulacoseira subarctica , Strain CCAP 1002/5" /LENGTH=124 /DNA_ID=CAMNT_0013164763 /DNA_START=116 /DNA_END=490 /DNA_ORIENTATION=-